MDDSTDPAPFADLAAYTQLRRMTAIALDPDGHRLVATVQEPDAKGARYVWSLWGIAIDGTAESTRLTHSEVGEISPAFRPDGELLFISTRPDAAVADKESALWSLPVRGEAKMIANRSGRVSGPVVATRSGTVVLAGSALAGSTPDADDERRRSARKDLGISAILHTGMPIRFWDHELGDMSPRLFLLESSGALRDLAPDAGFALTNADYSISADGGTVVTTWRVRRAHGTFLYGLACIATESGERAVLVSEAAADYQAPRISPDGSRVAALREATATFDSPWTWSLRILNLDGGHVVVDLGDMFPTEWAWSPDSATLYVAGDLHGRGGLVAVDPSTGAVTATLGSYAVHSNLHVAPDGSTVYTLCSAVDRAPRAVAIDVDATGSGVDGDGAVTMHLPTPAPAPDLPGRLVELDLPVGDAQVHAWLCLPEPGDTPAAVMTWIHGGPLSSYNSWNWRWNPWVAVAHGWAVVLPDPALSTGYGPAWIDRGWPYLAERVWADVEGVLDAVLQRPDVDATRTACLGGSFGGYMVNWIAGHTDRFGAIVSHAGLWAADQQHATTDHAAFKTGLFGRPADHSEWYAQNSPHHFVADISTPILLSHGSRDYRVPVSESMRCWWDLVDAWGGDPDDLPHRFLQFTEENHWVLAPSNAQIWWHTVLGFCGHHVRGDDWIPSELLP